MKKYKNIVYLDHNATTYLDEHALQQMLPYLQEKFANPSSIYRPSQDNRIVIERARDSIKALLGTNQGEIIFTGGGSESDNLAIKGFAYANQHRGRHIITSSIEHQAVLRTCQYLETQGFEVTYLNVDKNGIIDLDELQSSIKNDTILISIMYANNETGVLQPIRKISALARQNNIVFHSDAVQAIGKVNIDLKQDQIDMLTVSAHKFYGPKGVGALYIRDGIKLQPIIHGGHQESGMRAGTENIAGIVGLTAAMEKTIEQMPQENKRQGELRDRLQEGIINTIPECIVNGDISERLPNTLNVIIKYIEGEGMLLLLDKEKIYVSSGSACTSGSLDPSHVLLAMGIPHEYAHGSLRISLGKDNTKDDITKLLEVLPIIVDKLRKMSPLWQV